MALYLARAGSNGEYENRFLEDGCIYFTWTGLHLDLTSQNTLEALYAVFDDEFPDWKKGKQQNSARQAYAFITLMKEGDWIAMPSKFNPTIHFGKIVGDYTYHPDNNERFYHSRKVEWFAQDIPRDNFDQDILFSMGAFLTFCGIRRNNAEERVREMASNNWRVPKLSPATLSGSSSPDEETVDEDNASFNIEQTAYDQISRLIIAKFKGHGLARLVAQILEAQGYTVYQPPEGPDQGVDLLAAPGNLGFDHPRVCVQVKSEEKPIEREVLDKLLGTMQNVRAEQGLLVSWGGFKNTIERERANQFFRVRLWNRNELIENLLSNYDKLDDDLKAELPLKRIWTISTPEDSIG